MDFKYGQRVSIIKGFYEGIDGSLIDIMECSIPEYLVQLVVSDGDIKTVWIKQDYLELFDKL